MGGKKVDAVNFYELVNHPAAYVGSDFEYVDQSKIISPVINAVTGGIRGFLLDFSINTMLFKSSGEVFAMPGQALDSLKVNGSASPISSVEFSELVDALLGENGDDCYPCEIRLHGVSLDSGVYKIIDSLHGLENNVFPRVTFDLDEQQKKELFKWHNLSVNEESGMHSGIPENNHDQMLDLRERLACVIDDNKDLQAKLEAASDVIEKQKNEIEKQKNENEQLQDQVRQLQSELDKRVSDRPLPEGEQVICDPDDPEYKQFEADFTNVQKNSSLTSWFWKKTFGTAPKQTVVNSHVEEESRNAVRTPTNT